jgi:UDP-glucose 4-epimerase
MVLPRFVKQALNNEDITIYDNGSQTRVFCHVQDAVRAVIAITKDDSTIGDYFNIGGVGETTMKQLAEKVIERTKSKSKLICIPFSEAYGPGFEDMHRRVPDISKVKAKIGWAPTHTLDSIIDSVISHQIIQGG